MLITSAGIFGYLSKSHIEQGAPVGNNVVKIERLDKRIVQEQKTIDDSQSVVLQLDNAVKTLTEYDRIRGADGAIAVRQSQKEERESLRALIDSAQVKIGKYEDERFELQSTVRAFEVEVGPIKYVADMIYGNHADAGALESAVRGLILIIIFVFDPLAVLLLIAANYSLIESGVKLHPKTLNVAKLHPKNEIKDEEKNKIEPVATEPYESYGNIVDKAEDQSAQLYDAYAEFNETTLEEKLEQYTPEMVEESEVPEPIIVPEPEIVAKTDDKVIDNQPRKLSGIRGWLIKNTDKHNKES